MKKSSIKALIIIFGISLLLSTPTLFLPPRAPIVVNEIIDDSALPVPIIGTWRRVSDPSRVYVFREDGTGLATSSLGRHEITWRLVGTELQTFRNYGNTRRRYSIEDGILVVRVPGGGAAGVTESTERYAFYSEKTNLYEASIRLNWTALIVLGIVGFLAIAFVVSKILEWKKAR